MPLLFRILQQIMFDFITWVVSRLTWCILLTIFHVGCFRISTEHLAEDITPADAGSLFQSLEVSGIWDLKCF